MKWHKRYDCLPTDKIAYPIDVIFGNITRQAFTDEIIRFIVYRAHLHDMGHIRIGNIIVSSPLSSIIGSMNVMFYAHLQRLADVRLCGV